MHTPKRLNIIAAIAATTITLLSSCLGGDDADATYYDDTAVTSFTLDEAKLTRHTQSQASRDSVYTVALTPTGCKFYIDQLTAQIYNADSLPVGTDAGRALCTITTQNGGTAIWVLTNQAGEDSLARYSSTDSVDLSVPRRLQIYSNSGAAMREYTVKVNVHRQDSLGFAWSQATLDALANAEGRKLVTKGGQAYLFCSIEGQLTSFRHDATGWVRQEGETGVAGQAVATVIAQDSRFYAFSEGNVLTSSDAITWTPLPTPAGLTRLLGATDNGVYAMANGGIIMSADGGNTWTEETLDDNADNLPTEDVNFTWRPSRTNDNTAEIVVVGKRDGKIKIWKKTEENAEGSERQPWTYYSDGSSTENVLPPLAGLRVVRYAQTLVAAGGNLTAFYVSQDDGLTWFADNSFALPNGMTGQAPMEMTVDGDQFLTAVLDGGTTLLRGRLAYLGWEKQGKAVTK